MKILIADDQEQFIHLMQTKLEEFGETDVARNGREAFQMYCKQLKSEHPYDLLCVDLEMPSQSGIKTIQMIREIEEKVETPTDARVKIIVVSGHETDSCARNAIDSGGDDYVAKSTVAKDLPVAVKKLFREQNN